MEEDDTAETEDMESIVEALKQRKKQNKKLEDQMKNWIPKPGDANKYHTAEILPWATLTSNAVGRQHVMPVMTLRGGQVQGPNGQTAVVVGGVADVEYTRVPLVFHNEGPMTVKCQSLSGSREGEHRAWFRSAVLAGLPNQVIEDLQKNPDFAVADSVQWERHVSHRLQLEQDRANKQKKELGEAQASLLKLQLAEARNKACEKKKEEKEKTEKMMIVATQPGPGPEWPDSGPGPCTNDGWPANAPRQNQPTGNWGTGGSYRGRGGSAEGVLRARNTGNLSSVPWNVCWRCGAEGHWSRNCPERRQNNQRRGYQSQARGAPRARDGYRGAYQAPNPSAAPAAQYPVSDWREDQY